MPSWACLRSARVALAATIVASTIGLSSTPASAAHFVDVPAGAFYADDVEELFDRGLTTGSPAGSTTYRPEQAVTRGETVTFLYRMSQSPSGYPALTVFDDVPSRFFTVPVSWAYFIGLTTGSPAKSETFKPDDAVSRAEMVTFLWRCAGQPVVSDDHGFGDVPAASFYEAALRWAKSTGVTTGSPSGSSTFRPDAPTSRGEMASFIGRLGRLRGWAPCTSGFSADIADEPYELVPGGNNPDAVADMAVLVLVNGTELTLRALLASAGKTAVAEALGPCVGDCGPYGAAEVGPFCESGDARTVTRTTVVLEPGDYLAAVSAPGTEVIPFDAEWPALEAGRVYEFCVLERLS